MSGIEAILAAEEELGLDKETVKHIDHHSIDEVGKHVNNLPEHMSPESKKNIEGKILMIVGPLIIAAGGALAMKELSDLGTEDNFQKIMQAGQLLVSTGILGFGFETLMNGLKKVHA